SRRTGRRGCDSRAGDEVRRVVGRPGSIGVTVSPKRVALATLMRIAEPGTAFATYVGQHGPEAALAHLREGRSIDGVDVAALRHRLTDASGAEDLRRAAAAGARLVTPDDEEWPPPLLDLQRLDPPMPCHGLWVCGEQRLAEMCS